MTASVPFVLLGTLAVLSPALADPLPGAEGDIPLRNASPDGGLTDWTGMLVTARDVVVLGEVGSAADVPAESLLAPLLRVRPGRAYSPVEAREDLAMIHRLLDAARAEVRVIPVAPRDGVVESVRVQYRLALPTRLRRIAIRGNRALPDGDLRAAADLAPGDAFFAEEADAVARAMRDAYRAAGFPRAEVSAALADAGAGQVDLALEVQEGARQELAEVRVGANAALGAWRARRVLARAGLRRGALLSEGVVARAREALLESLRRDGWWDARVNIRIESVGPTADRALVLVNPGRRWRLAVEGPGMPGMREARARVLAEARRTTADLASDVARAIEAERRAAGWTEAKVSGAVEVARRGRRATLRLRGDAGLPRVRGAVIFEGDTVFGARFLEDALVEASPDVIGRGRVTAAAVDRGLLALREYFRAQGYLDATLERVALEERAAPLRVPVDVRVRVVPGPRVSVTRVVLPSSVDGVDPAPVFAGVEGAACNPADLDLRARRLVELLAEKGRLSADARARVVRTPGAASAEVVVEWEPGPTVYLRAVAVKGYRRTRRALVTGAADLKPGDPLAPSRVDALRQRLYGLGVFQRVRADLVGDDDRTRDLVVDVVERAPLYLELGGGLATDQGVRTFARAGHRNLFGAGHRLTFVGEGGVGWVGDGWTLDRVAPRWRAALRYEAPRLPRADDQLAVDLLVRERQQERPWRMERSGGATAVRLAFGPRTTAEFGYRVQQRRLLDLDPGVLVDGEAWLGPLGLDAVGVDPRPVLPGAPRWQSGPEASLVVDRRDDPFNPTRGALGSLVVTAADGALSDAAFVRGEAAWAWWAPLGPTVLHARARGGASASLDGRPLPLEDRFRLGGSSTLRGYDLGQAGPANEVADESLPWPDVLSGAVAYGGDGRGTRWVPTGGDAMALASVECRVPAERLHVPGGQGTEVALFADVGNAWMLHGATTSSRRGSDPPLRLGAGVGLRRGTPIGPVQVDVGVAPWRLEARGEAAYRFHFTLGAL
ncbi:MAG: hypothetical protein RLZZ299_1682 [Pseudomonadota bacterium]